MKDVILGCIAGDIAGALFEWDSTLAKEVVITEDSFKYHNSFTDDTIATLAVLDSLDYTDNTVIFNTQNFKDICKRYPRAGWGGKFREYLNSPELKSSFHSKGNGAAMRIAAVTLLPQNLWDEAATLVNSVSHDHPTAHKWVRILLDCYSTEPHQWPAYTQDYINSITDKGFSELIEDTVPLAIKAAKEASSFTDALTRAINYGLDADTIACITGGLATMRFSIPEQVKIGIMGTLENYPDLIDILSRHADTRQLTQYNTRYRYR
jgi:ADP-ribosylglycohydrolase